MPRSRCLPGKYQFVDQSENMLVIRTMPTLMLICCCKLSISALYWSIFFLSITSLSWSRICSLLLSNFRRAFFNFFESGSSSILPAVLWHSSQKEWCYSPRHQHYQQGSASAPSLGLMSAFMKYCRMLLWCLCCAASTNLATESCIRTSTTSLSTFLISFVFPFCSYFPLYRIPSVKNVSGRSNSL